MSPRFSGKESTLTKARTVLSYIAVRKLMISCADVARKLTISPTTVTRAASRATSLPKLKQIQKDLLGSCKKLKLIYHLKFRNL